MGTARPLHGHCAGHCMGTAPSSAWTVHGRSSARDVAPALGTALTLRVRALHGHCSAHGMKPALGTALTLRFGHGTDSAGRTALALHGHCMGTVLGTAWQGLDTAGGEHCVGAAVGTAWGSGAVHCTLHSLGTGTAWLRGEDNEGLGTARALHGHCMGTGRLSTVLGTARALHREHPGTAWCWALHGAGHPTEHHAGTAGSRTLRWTLHRHRMGTEHGVGTATGTGKGRALPRAPHGGRALQEHCKEAGWLGAQQGTGHCMGALQQHHGGCQAMQ